MITHIILKEYKFARCTNMVALRVQKTIEKKIFFQNSIVQICSRLIWECMEKISETLTTWIG